LLDPDLGRNGKEISREGRRVRALLLLVVLALAMSAARLDLTTMMT
jgi:predicted RNA-binding protein YlqC (UPF0109 family)